MSQVSLYKNNRDTKGFDPVSIKTIYKCIKNGKWEKHVSPVRALEYKSEEYNAAKNRLPAFTMSGVFPQGQRENNSIVAHSGRIVIDIDNIGDNIDDYRQKLEADEFSEAVFLSVGAKGLGVTVKINGEKHVETFIQLEQYYLEVYGIQIDKSCKNVARIRYVTYDPNMYLNMDSKSFEIIDAPKESQTSAFLPENYSAPEIRIAENEERSIANEIIRRCTALVDAAPRGQVHQEVMKASEVGGGYIAGGLVDEYEFKNAMLSSILAKPKCLSREKEAKKVEDGIRHGKLSPLTELLVDASKQLNKPVKKKNYGINWKSMTAKQKEACKEVLSLAHSHNRAGDDIKLVTDYLAEFCKINTDIELREAVKIVKKVYDLNRIFFGFDKKKKVEKTEIIVADKWDLRYNVMTNTVDYKLKESKEFEPIRIENVYRFAQHQDLKYSMADLKHLLNSDFVENYDPMKNYFEGLKKWDGKDYIKNLSEHIKVKNQPFFETMLKKHLVRSVGCGLGNEVNRYVFTIAGEKQSTGKTYFIRWLCPFKKDYYTEASISAKDKDTKIAAAKNFMGNIDELAGLKKSDTESLKSLISLQKINERLPYGQSSVTMLRRINYWASTNKRDFLTDSENTRWLIFELISINRMYSRDIDVNDIWSQAYAMYKDKNYNAQLTREEEAVQQKENTGFDQQDIEEEAIKKHFRVVDDTTHSFYAVFDVMTKLNELYGAQKFNTVALGRAMKKVGFLSGVKTVNGKKQRGYYAEMIMGNYKEEEDFDEKPF